MNLGMILTGIAGLCGGAVVAAGFCLSRALSGLAVATFPLARDTGLAHTSATRAHRRRTGRSRGRSSFSAPSSRPENRGQRASTAKISSIVRLLRWKSNIQFPSILVE